MKASFHTGLLFSRTTRPVQQLPSQLTRQYGEEEEAEPNPCDLRLARLAPCNNLIRVIIKGVPVKMVKTPL